MKSIKCYTTHDDCNGNYCKLDIRTYSFEFMDESIIGIEAESLGDAIVKLKKRYGQDVTWTIAYHRREVK